MLVWPVTDDEYHADKEHISSGMVRCMSRGGPLDCYTRYVAGQDKPESDALRFGSAFHLAMECLDWASKVRVMPDSVDGEPLNLRLKAHREARDAFVAEGGLWVTPDEWRSLQAMLGAVMANPEARLLVEMAGECEVPIRNVCAETGLWVKAKPDKRIGDVLVDWKTTRHVGADRFLWDLKDYGYDQQAAHYVDVDGEADTFLIVAVDKAGLECNVFDVTPMLGEARKRNRAAMRMIRDCMAGDNWHSPGWGTVIRTKGGA